MRQVMTEDRLGYEKIETRNNKFVYSIQSIIMGFQGHQTFQWMSVQYGPKQSVDSTLNRVAFCDTKCVSDGNYFKVKMCGRKDR